MIRASHSALLPAHCIFREALPLVEASCPCVRQLSAAEMCFAVCFLCEKFIVFSERELTFMFAICYSPSVCRLSVCNVREPIQPVEIFCIYFYAVWYLGHALTFTQKFTEVPQGNRSNGGFKHKRGSQI